MTDLEMKKLCAEAIGFELQFESQWDPLHDGAQVEAMVEMFHICLVPGIRTPKGRGPWHAEIKSPDWQSYSTDLKRAVVECVAKMQASKLKSGPAGAGIDGRAK